ncbi:hypothetical protein EDD21DRAFT_440069 [Dissophora ornata]|nr:hypothetical protein EDD21DRAFT_440069 [Dissophora ornata]
MGVTQAFELIKDCEAIKLVDPRKESPCEIDGSAVSYMKFKTTEGRLLLKQLKKMAKEDVSVGVPGPVLRLAHWDQGSPFPSPVATKGLASDLFALHLSTAPDPTLACNTSSTYLTTTQQVSSSTGLLYSASDALPPPSHPPTDVYHELNLARDVVWPLLANVLNKMYDKFYKKSDDFIHYDGPPTTQKAFAHGKRQLATKKQHLKLSKCAGQFDVCVARKARENPNLMTFTVDNAGSKQQSPPTNMGKTRRRPNWLQKRRRVCLRPA